MGKKTVEKSDEALTRLRGIFVIDKRLTVREKQKREGKHVSSGSVHNTQTTVPTIMYTERNQPPSQLWASGEEPIVQILNTTRIHFPISKCSKKKELYFPAVENMRRQLYFSISIYFYKNRNRFPGSEIKIRSSVHIKCLLKRVLSQSDISSLSTSSGAPVYNSWQKMRRKI